MNLNGKEVWSFVAPILARHCCDNADFSDAYAIVYKALKDYDNKKIENMVQAEAIEWEYEEMQSSGISMRILDALSKKGLSQRKLAERCKITEATMSRYCKGERVPKATTIGVIADALEVTTDYLIYGKR